MESSENARKWGRPLDNLKDCIEYVYTFYEYELDVPGYIGAVQFLVQHRAELTEDVEFAVPPPDGDWQGMTDDAAWQDVIAGSEGVCGCGQHRVIKAAPIAREFQPAEDRPTVLAAGQSADIFPVGGPQRRALIQVSILSSGEQSLLTLTDRPYSHGNEMGSLLAALAPKGYPLDRLAAAMAQSKDKPTCGKDRTLFRIEAVDPVAKTVTLVPDASLEIQIAS